ncbi:MAG: sensor histidine kinase [bacterium]
MSLSFAFKALRYLSMISLMLAVWLLLGMVYFERFFPPFDAFALRLLPWKRLGSIPLDAGLKERLAIMQQILDSSATVGRTSLFAMIISFMIFIFYLTFVYQQRQRKIHENRLLLLKNREIARRNEFIRYISATISHEFKNNLVRIKRRLEMMQDLPQDTLVRMNNNFDKLFADIDIFKRISDEREAGLIEFKGVDLSTALFSLIEQHSDLADIRIRNTTGVPQLLISASEELLRTVFENLIDNAVKYKKSDQERARVSITCSMDQDGSRRYLQLSFRDEGIGMNEQQADQSFYKGKSSGQGWGEGLYFVKYAIGLHAGKIRVGKEYTQPGIGTEIIIHLPYVEEAFHV